MGRNDGSDLLPSGHPVIAANRWQVRQKIYSSSVGRWKNYEKFIGPLLPLRKLG